MLTTTSSSNNEQSIPIEKLFLGGQVTVSVQIKGTGNLRNGIRLKSVGAEIEILERFASAWILPSNNQNSVLQFHDRVELNINTPSQGNDLTFSFETIGKHAKQNRKFVIIAIKVRSSVDGKEYYGHISFESMRLENRGVVQRASTTRDSIEISDLVERIADSELLSQHPSFMMEEQPKANDTLTFVAEKMAFTEGPNFGEQLNWISIKVNTGEGGQQWCWDTNSIIEAVKNQQFTLAFIEPSSSHGTCATIFGITNVAKDDQGNFIFILYFKTPPIHISESNENCATLTTKIYVSIGETIVETSTLFYTYLKF